MIPIQYIYIIRNAAPKRCPKTSQNNINNTQHNQKNTRNSDASKNFNFNTCQRALLKFRAWRYCPVVLHATLLHHGLLHVLCFFHQCLQPPGDDSNRRRFRGNQIRKASNQRSDALKMPILTRVYHTHSKPSQNPTLQMKTHVLTCVNMF